MSLQLEVDNLDGIDDAVKSFYVEKDGKFQLNVDGLPTQNDIDRLNAKASTAEREAITRRRALEGFKALGKTPEEIQAMFDAQAAAEQKKLEEQGDFKKILEQHQAKWAERESDLTKRADGAEKALKSYVGESAFISELAKNGVTEEGISLLPREYLSRIDVGMNGGKPSLSILHPDGETPMAGDSKDGLATISDLVAESVKSYPSLFKSDARGGGGKQPGNGAGSSGKSVTRQVFEGMTHVERAAHFKNGGSVVNA